MIRSGFKSSNICFWFCILAICNTSCSSESSRIDSFAKAFDERIKQTTVSSYEQTLKVLAKFPKVKWESLPAWYRKLADPDKKFNAQMIGKNFYKIKGEEIFYFLAGNYRLLDFIPEDSLYAKNIELLPEGIDNYFMLDSRAIAKLLDLQKALRKKGYDEQALKITNGYRYPSFNKEIGGAPYSRHIFGEAVDADVLDINRDGKSDSLDKKIVLDLLDQSIIQSEGGVGRYPGTDGVHWDVRGSWARWDTY